MKKKALIKRNDGVAIDAMHTGRTGSKSIIIFVHGFPKAQVKENNFFGFLAEEIPTYGASSLLFDYTSCDYNTGETSEFCFQSAHDDLNAVYAWVKRMGYDHIGIIAEGLGASIMLSNPPENCMLSVLCWPAFDLKQVKESVFHASEHIVSLQENGWLNHNDIKVGQSFIYDLENEDMVSHMEDFNAPSLILHGEKDSVFPPSHIDMAREHLMARRLEITTLDGAEHGLQRSSDRKCCLMHINQFLMRYTNQ